MMEPKLIKMKDFFASPQWSQLQVTLINWAPFFLISVWGIRFKVRTEFARYGDVLEVVWGANWYADAIKEGYWPLFTDKIFYPVGWPTSLLAHTPLFLLSMGVIRLTLSEAATFNLFWIGSYAVAYAGMRKVLGIHVQNRWIILLVATLFSFAGIRWVRYGHLNVLWMAALLPWLFWTLQSEMRGRKKMVVGGAFFALIVTASLYGIWLSSLVLLTYLLSYLSWQRLRQTIGMALLGGVLSLPTIIPFWLARQETSAPFFDIIHISQWGASLNSFILPSVYHPWFFDSIRQIYSSVLNEADVANFGLTASILCIGMLFCLNYKDWRQRQLVIALVLGTILALGPVLRWSHNNVSVDLFQGINIRLWSLGAALKPEIFPGSQPIGFQKVVPLPGYLFYLFMPFAEGARTAVRFAFVAGLGLYALVGMALERIAQRGVLVALGLSLLLLIEFVPRPFLSGLQLDSSQHEAFAWLAENRESRPGAILDLVQQDGKLDLYISGETLYATDIHGRSTAGGVSTMWPDAAWQLIYWLNSQSNPLESNDLGLWLDAYQVNFVSVKVMNAEQKQIVAETSNDRLKLIDCFSPATTPSPWPQPICLFEKQPATSSFQIKPSHGWSDAEEWGRWAEDTEVNGEFITAQPQLMMLDLETFPHCIEDTNQSIEIYVNENLIEQAQFTECEPMALHVTIPAERLKAGVNELSFQLDYAITPNEATNGANPDFRSLSIGVTNLTLSPVGE